MVVWKWRSWGLWLFLIWALAVSVTNATYLSTECANWLAKPDDFVFQSKYSTAFVVIYTKNPDRDLLLESVKSILLNSNIAETYSGKQSTVLLQKILIVDDFSSSFVRDWPEWQAFDSNTARHIEFLHSIEPKGAVQSKNDAMQYIRSKFLAADSSLVVLFDKPMIAGPQWLIPLANTLTKYPTALVYPAVDILAKFESRWEVAKSENVVAAFDWAFIPRWESTVDSSRSRLKFGPTDGTSEVISPAVPNVFAVSLTHFEHLGGFDKIVNPSAYAQENIELSIRNWLCGGSIFLQSCSRVAQTYEQLFNEHTNAGIGVTQAQIDTNTMNLALRWFSRPMDLSLLPGHAESNTGAVSTGSVGFTYREMAFESRFVGRVPYTVNTAVDAVRAGPPQSFYVSVDAPDGHGKVNQGLACASIEWYLNAIYPGLKLDISAVVSRFQQHVQNEHFLSEALQTTLAMYEHLPSFTVDASIYNALKARTSQYRDNVRKSLGIPNAPEHFLHRFKYEPPPIPKKHNGMTREDLLEAHNERVRSQLVCEDFNDPTKPNFCATESHNGNVQTCTNYKPSLLMMCPLSCGFCDAQLTFCEDFYLLKCKTWAANGMCGTSDKLVGPINDACRKSCNVCAPVYDKIHEIIGKSSDSNRNNEIISNKNNNNNQVVGKPESLEHNSIPNHVVPAAPVALKVMLPFDPTALHRDYLTGNLVDTFESLANHKHCDLNDKPNGLLLARVRVNQQYASHNTGVKIFCGVYTMEKNHETNVKATRNTWAKKCDGFIAFSTKMSPEFSAMFIEHEGDESYDNMWQKSRAIWKFINAQLHDQFDYFLLGGDDMFYIIENLRAYLNSEEIVRETATGKPLFLGRIFAPPNQIVFNSGGAGYLLNRKALSILGENLDKGHCFPHQRGFWEDVNVANCLLKSAQITPYQTRDALQRERFHPFNPGNHLTYRIPEKNPDWYAKYNPDLKLGYECCSEGSISFHYCPAQLMYTLYDYVYHCDHKVISDRIP